MKKLTTRKIAYVGMMAAAVYTASLLQIPIPTAIGNTRLHTGNVMCLLGGMLLGPMQGGMAAGIGSMFYDLTNPAYVASAPFTFAFKFAMAWICGRIASGQGADRKRRYIAGSALGSLTYMLLYLSKSFVEQRIVLGLPLEAVLLTTAQKALVSGTNAVIACLVAVPLGLALKLRSCKLTSDKL